MTQFSSTSVTTQAEPQRGAVHPGPLRLAALAMGGALLAASAGVQLLIGVPHLMADLRELAAHEPGGRPRLLGAISAGLWFGAGTLAVCAAVVLHALWQTRRGQPHAVAALRVVGTACAAYGLALGAGAGWSPHALGYVATGTLVVLGAGAGRRAR